MTIASVIKLIIIGVGMFFYYRTLEEEGGLYISTPIIAIATLFLALSLTLDKMGSYIFFLSCILLLYL